MQAVKERVALSSIAISAGMTLAKGAVGFASGSLAILSEAGHSLIDLVATVITYFAVRASGKPADAEHHFGHGKIESVAALAATSLLFVLAVYVFWEAGLRLFGYESHAVVAGPWAFAVIAASVVVDFFRARLLYRVANDTSSQALEADALHFRSDMWSSLAVLAGLGGVAADFAWADSLAAAVVAVFICVAGFRLGRRTIETLTDTAPAGAAEAIEAAARRVRGVVAVERVRVRPAGANLFAEVAVGVSRTLPLDRVTAVERGVVEAIGAEMPNTEVTVVTVPRALDDETVTERVMVIARNRALAVHHVTVHHLQDKLAVSLDLEVDGKLPLGRAHEIADTLEKAIAHEFSGEVEVETHIEPLQGDGMAGRDAAASLVAEIATALRALTPSDGPIRDVHNVRVRETAEGLIVNFHCRAAPSLSVDAVHEAVDRLERDLREQRRGVHRVIGHAEPA
ncbi:MAG TPA: cation diffusion facilitator family transporter [Xanthobacteraceae bacterium]|nr:cation diffusion facilitator family transporter [Xanthobacteraceae bacterium]